MSRKTIQQIIAEMDPKEALAALAEAGQALLPHLDAEARLDFLARMAGGPNEDKVASMVHL